LTNNVKHVYMVGLEIPCMFRFKMFSLGVFVLGARCFLD